MVDSLKTPTSFSNFTFKTIGTNSLLGRLSDPVPSPQTTSVEEEMEEDEEGDLYADMEIDTSVTEPHGERPTLLARLSDPANISGLTTAGFIRSDGTLVHPAFTPSPMLSEARPAFSAEAIEQPMIGLSSSAPTTLCTITIPENGTRESASFATHTGSFIVNSNIAANGPPQTDPLSPMHQATLGLPTPPPSSSILPIFSSFPYTPLNELLHEERAAWCEVLETRRTSLSDVLVSPSQASSSTQTDRTRQGAALSHPFPEQKNQIDSLPAHPHVIHFDAALPRLVAVASDPTPSPVIDVPISSDLFVGKSCQMQSNAFDETMSTDTTSTNHCFSDINHTLEMNVQSSSAHFSEPPQIRSPREDGLNDLLKARRNSERMESKGIVQRDERPSLLANSPKADTLASSLGCSILTSQDVQERNTITNLSGPTGSGNGPLLPTCPSPKPLSITHDISHSDPRRNENEASEFTSSHSKGALVVKRKASTSLPRGKDTHPCHHPKRQKTAADGSVKIGITGNDSLTPPPMTEFKKSSSLPPKPAFLPPKPIVSGSRLSSNASRRHIDSKITAVKAECGNSASSANLFPVKKEEQDDSKTRVKVEEGMKPMVIRTSLGRATPLKAAKVEDVDELPKVALDKQLSCITIEESQATSHQGQTKSNFDSRISAPPGGTNLPRQQQDTEQQNSKIDSEERISAPETGATSPSQEDKGESTFRASESNYLLRARISDQNIGSERFVSHSRSQASSGDHSGSNAEPSINGAQTTREPYERASIPAPLAPAPSLHSVRAPLASPETSLNQSLSRRSSVSDPRTRVNSPGSRDGGTSTYGDVYPRGRSRDRSRERRYPRVHDHYSPPRPSTMIVARSRPIADTYRPAECRAERGPVEYARDFGRADTSPRYSWRDRQRIPSQGRYRSSRSRSPPPRRAQPERSHVNPGTPRQRGYSRSPPPSERRSTYGAPLHDPPTSSRQLRQPSPSRYRQPELPLSRDIPDDRDEPQRQSVRNDSTQAGGYAQPRAVEARSTAVACPSRAAGRSDGQVLGPSNRGVDDTLSPGSRRTQSNSSRAVEDDALPERQFIPNVTYLRAMEETGKNVHAPDRSRNEHSPNRTRNMVREQQVDESTPLNQEERALHTKSGATTEEGSHKLGGTPNTTGRVVHLAPSIPSAAPAVATLPTVEHRDVPSQNIANLPDANVPGDNNMDLGQQLSAGTMGRYRYVDPIDDFDTRPRRDRMHEETKNSHEIAGKQAEGNDRVLHTEAYSSGSNLPAAQKAPQKAPHLSPPRTPVRPASSQLASPPSPKKGKGTPKTHRRVPSNLSTSDINHAETTAGVEESANPRRLIFRVANNSSGPDAAQGRPPSRQSESSDQLTPRDPPLLSRIGSAPGINIQTHSAEKPVSSSARPSLAERMTGTMPESSIRTALPVRQRESMNESSGNGHTGARRGSDSDDSPALLKRLGAGQEDSRYAEQQRERPINSGRGRGRGYGGAQTLPHNSRPSNKPSLGERISRH